MVAPPDSHFFSSSNTRNNTLSSRALQSSPLRSAGVSNETSSEALKMRHHNTRASPPSPSPLTSDTQNQPDSMEKYRNWRKCYKEKKTEQNTSVTCRTLQSSHGRTALPNGMQNYKVGSHFFVAGKPLKLILASLLTTC